MNITVIGCGYVGLVTAAGLADFGHLVTAVDIDRVKIDLLNHGQIPIFEEGLQDIVASNMKAKRLSFSNKMEKSILDSQVIFVAVGTPSQEDGSADLSQVEEVSIQIAHSIKDYKIIVNKSTVPLGTGRWVQELIRKNQRVPCEFDVVSNPEFLREGSAINDFLKPERVVIGTESLKAKEMMKKVYQEHYRAKIPFIFTNLETAELIKYASNAFLATKIAFINEIARICDRANADVQVVAKGMGLDSRIGPNFLNVSPGYGGSCFPKDTKALVEIARSSGVQLTIVEAVVASNETQKQLMFQKIKRVVGDLKGKTLAALGLAFKANTDDMRESPAIPIIKNLLAAGAEVKVHDPKAIKEAQKVFGDSVQYCENIYDTLTGTDALVIITEWSIYRDLDFSKISSLMKTPILIDLRNIYQSKDLQRTGFLYEGVGRGIKQEMPESKKITTITKSIL